MKSKITMNLIQSTLNRLEIATEPLPKIGPGLRKLLKKTKKKVDRKNLKKEIEHLKRLHPHLVPRDTDINIQKNWDQKIQQQKDSGVRGNAIMQSLRKILNGPEMRLSLNSILVFDLADNQILQMLQQNDYVPWIKLYPAHKEMKNWLVNPRKGIVVAVGPSKAVHGKRATSVYHISFAEALEKGEAAQKALNVKPIGKLSKDKLQQLLRKELGDAKLADIEQPIDKDSEGTQPYGNDEVAYVIYDGLVEYNIEKLGWIQILVVRNPYRSGKLLATIIDTDVS